MYYFREGANWQFTHSRDEGRTWADASNIRGPGEYRLAVPDYLPSLAVNPLGTIVFATACVDPVRGDLDICTARSGDGGATFDKEVVVNFNAASDTYADIAPRYARFVHPPLRILINCCAALRVTARVSGYILFPRCSSGSPSGLTHGGR